MNGKKTMSASQLAGLIFSLLGGIFFLVGILVLIFLKQKTATVFAWIYLPIGSVFLLIGLLLLYLHHRKNVRLKQIVENGYYVMAKVERIIANVNLTYQNIHPYFISCTYQDENGKEHRFRSRNLMFNPTGIVFLIREINKKFIEKRLVRRSQYVNAIVKSVAIDAGVEYGGTAGTMALKKNLQGAGKQDPIYTTHPLYCQCSYVDPSGVEHLFRSKSMLGLDQDKYLNQYVKVYYQGEDYKKYYVEL